MDMDDVPGFWVEAFLAMCRLVERLYQPIAAPASRRRA